MQELKTVALMLHKITFLFSTEVIALHLDNSTAKAYLCNQDGRASLFLSTLACHILNLAHKHGITLIPAYIATYFNVETNYFPWGWFVPEWHLLDYIAQAVFNLWDQLKLDVLASSHTNQCQHYYTLEIPLHLGAFGLNTLSHPWTYQVTYHLALVPLVLSKFLAEHVTDQFILLISVVPCWKKAPCFPQFSTFRQTFLVSVPS